MIAEGGEQAILEACGVRSRAVRWPADKAKVLVLHGWGGSVESMSPAIRELVSEYDVLALDFPGHGQSSLPPEAWGTEAFCQWLGQILRQVAFFPCSILAHSHGGRVSMRFAAERAEMVNSLVLVDTSGLKPPRPASYYVKIGAAKFGKLAARYFGPLGAKLRDAVYRRIASKDYLDSGALRPTFVRLVNEDVAPFLPRIAARTLLVWGGADKDVPIEVARRLRREIATSALVVFKGAGHFPYLDETARFGLIVRRFLRGDEVVDTEL